MAGRFTILGLAGRGGMGTVYRAQDALSAELVALKVLRADVPLGVTARFIHEAQILAELRHPGIVHYVAHGQMSDGNPYLAMEWLDGEDLAARLARTGVSASQSLTLVKAVASALAIAHRRGIIHRDLKPSNLFLRHNDIAQVTILDFGIAHRPRPADNTQLTQTGAVMGTPAYMSPEQARGERGILPSADSFSLGAILFESLTGQPAFSGEHYAAVLAKILFADPTRLRELRPELPPALDALVAQLLSKDPAARPADADAISAVLRNIGPLSDDPPRRVQNQSHRKRLTHEEQHFVCALAAALPSLPVESEATIYPQSLSAEAAESRRRLEHSLALFGAEVEWLLDGTLICRMSRISHIADQARQAGRAALAISRAWPEALVVAATGRGQRNETGGLLIGMALDQVVRMLRAGSSLNAPAGRVLLDELTTRFLDARFRTEPLSSGVFTLLEITEEARLEARLLGRPTQFVGREQELGSLLSSYLACKEESIARAVIVTAPPGAGKSRLLQELRRRIADGGSAVHWLMAQADPLGLGTHGGLIGQAIARFCGLSDIEDAETRRSALKRLAATHVDAAEAAQVAAFLGELCGVPFPEDDHPILAAARLSPQLRSDQMRQAVLNLLAALTRERPTLFVLEDLHWGDEQTVRFLDTALRELGEQPLMVLAFARPEVHEVFDKLWSERNVQELRLPPLGKRACEQLLRSALGEHVDSDVRARIITQSSGNALFLEELIRAQNEGHVDAVPPTVLAMLQARLLRIASGLRRVLRAASVFGSACWRDGIIMLLGGEDETLAVESALQALVSAEILERRGKSRLFAQVEYGWRHALMQQAAYTLLSDRDRALGHAQAAAFLLSCGAGEPAEIAGHYEHGGDKERAVPHYLRAAEHAYGQHELQLALRYIDRAHACGAGEKSDTLALAAALQCLTYRYLGEHGRMVDAAEVALPLLARGSTWWFKILYNLSLPLRIRGERARVVTLAEQWASADPLPGAEAAHIDAGAWFLVVLAQMAEYKAATFLWQRLEEIEARQPSCPEYLAGLIGFARYEYRRVFAPDPWRQLEEVRGAGERLVKSGGPSEACGAQISLGQALAELGDLAGSVQHLEACVPSTEKLRQPYLVIIAKAHLMAALAGRAETAPAAERMANELLGTAIMGTGYRGWAHTILGQECLRRESLDEAAAHLEKAVAMSPGSPLRRLYASSLRVHLLLRQDQPTAAHALAEELLAEAFERGGGGYCATALGLAAICARWSIGDHAGAAVLHEATAQEVMRRARRFPDEAARARYLTEFKENVVACSAAPWSARFPL